MFTIYTTKTMPSLSYFYKKIGKNGVCTLLHKNMAAIQSDYRHANKHNNYERNYSTRTSVATILA